MVRGLIISLLFFFIGTIFSCSIQRKRCQSVTSNRNLKYTIDFVAYETGDSAIIHLLQTSAEYAKSQSFQDCLNDAFFLMYKRSGDTDTISVDIIQDDLFFSTLPDIRNRDIPNNELIEEVFYSLQVGAIFFEGQTFIIISPERFGNKLVNIDGVISLNYSYYVYKNVPVLFNFHKRERLMFVKENNFFELVGARVLETNPW